MDGFRCVRQEGDHLIYTKPGVLRPVVIPKSLGVPVFIIKNNLRTAGMVMPQSPGIPGGISFSLSRAVVENGPDKLKLIPQGVQYLPETEALPGMSRERYFALLQE